MEHKAEFQNLQNPDDILIVVILTRQSANVPGVFYDWDTVATIRIISGDSPLGGQSFPVAGDDSAGYDEAVKHILKQHPEYMLVPA